MGAPRAPRLRRYAAALAVAVSAAAALTACSGGGGPDVDVSGSWVLVSGRAADGSLPVSPGHRVTLTFADGSARGTAPCNDYGAPYSVDGDRLDLSADGGISVTATGCEGADGALEAAYLSALGASRAVARGSDTLVLTGEGTELAFRLAEPWPRAEVVGRTWWLTSWSDDAGIEHPATRSADGRPFFRLATKGARGGLVTVGSGCRTMTGHWTDDGGQPRITGGAWRGDCLHVTDQERAVESVLSELVVEVRDRAGRQELVVRSAHGSGGTVLVYGRRP